MQWDCMTEEYSGGEQAHQGPLPFAYVSQGSSVTEVCCSVRIYGEYVFVSSNHKV